MDRRRECGGKEVGRTGGEVGWTGRGRADKRRGGGADRRKGGGADR